MGVQSDHHKRMSMIVEIHQDMLVGGWSRHTQHVISRPMDEDSVEHISNFVADISISWTRKKITSLVKKFEVAIVLPDFFGFYGIFLCFLVGSLCKHLYFLDYSNIRCNSLEVAGK